VWPSDNYKYRPDGGYGTFVYVLDSGINAGHEEFQGRVINRMDFTGGAASNRRHGTHVAGIVAGAKYGVAKKASIIDVQVFDDRGADIDIIADGLTWAITDILTSGRVGKAVINMSISTGNGVGSTTVERILKEGVKDGIPIVVAAGNRNRDAGEYRPARVREAITVAAINKDLRRRGNSNFGKTVDIFAPGGEITAAGNRDNTHLLTLSGTSMAAPHVAGVVADFLSLEGPRTPEEIMKKLKRLAFKNRVRDTKGSPNLLLHNGLGTKGPGNWDS
jgi:subtilisin family serine protease